MAMAEPNFGPIGDDPADDLPRTFRREKEAREREARDRAARDRAPAAPSLSPSPDAYVDPAPQVQPVIADMPFPAVVRGIDVPFLQLMTFFLKAVLAAIPALILLGVILWFAGHLLQGLFPDLVKMKILISFPNG
jgi:hypothetical protein